MSLIVTEQKKLEKRMNQLLKRLNHVHLLDRN